MISTTDKPILNYFKDKANDISDNYEKLRNISSNRHGLMIGTIQAILRYQQNYGPHHYDAVVTTLNKAQAWSEWACMLPHEKWHDYAVAREIPFMFLDLWNEYKASGSTEKFMTWCKKK